MIDRRGKVVAAVALLAAVAVAVRMLPLADWTRELEAWRERLGPAAGLAFGVLYVVAALLLVPGGAITLAAGFLFGVVRGTIIVSIASTTAAALAFLLARTVARQWVEERARRDRRFAAVDRAIGKHGWKFVALLRLSPVVPFSLSNYLYGLTAVRFWPYVAASWAAMLPATVLYVSLGAAGQAGLSASSGGRARTSAEYAYLGAGIAATLAVTVVLTRIARRSLAETGAEPAVEPGAAKSAVS